MKKFFGDLSMTNISRSRYSAPVRDAEERTYVLIIALCVRNVLIPEVYALAVVNRQHRQFQHRLLLALPTTQILLHLDSNDCVLLLGNFFMEPSPFYKSMW
jgi:hypothetical protein